MENTTSALIKRLREARGWSQDELAKKIGISQPGLAKIENGGNTRKIVEIAKIFGVTAEELSRGVIHEGVARTDDKARIDTNVSPGPDVRGMLPLISWVQAGSFCDVIDNLAPGDAEAWYPCPVTHTPNAYVLRVEGESMSPEYRDGEMIFVDPRGGYVHGDDIIVRTPEGKATFKRLQVTQDGTFLLAINPAWPERIIRIPDNSQICGKVIFQGRPR
ncbi:LexA family protein [Microvirgula aerodenitrificans]|uniref:LexA family protein n=1 Tax=Microvirgula aerodenitrificans TaxID=57480 RepID=UPI00056CC805|nr:XRE family transcriptional regulator [Microvirgula aerodenitrificans]